MRNFNPIRLLEVLGRALAPASILILLLFQSVQGQTARVRVQENFRAEPAGDVIGVLEPGLQVTVEETRGNWTRITVEGWMWARSLRTRDESAFDLRVSEVEGENLRAEPRGERIARLNEGALLEEVAREPGWIRVRRTAWFWSASLDSDAAVSDRDRDASAAGEGSLPSPPSQEGPEWLVHPSSTVPLLTGADGDTLANVRPGTELQVISRQGNWTRVRLEGWVWEPAFPASEVGDSSAAVAGPLTPEVLAANPESFRGRVVTWDLQFLSVERAEAIRTDFYEGEPFILARYGGASGPFVYVAFPPDRLLEINGLTALERITVVGRVRTGRAALTGSPILDLLELRRTGGGR